MNIFSNFIPAAASGRKSYLMPGLKPTRKFPSPDGRHYFHQLGWVEVALGALGGYGEMVIHDKTYPIREALAEYPVWSPDSRYLLLPCFKHYEETFYDLVDTVEMVRLEIPEKRELILNAKYKDGVFTGYPAGFPKKRRSIKISEFINPKPL